MLAKHLEIVLCNEGMVQVGKWEGIKEELIAAPNARPIGCMWELSS